MHAQTREVLRGAQDTSLHRSLELLAAGRVDGAISAGSTQALLALGRRQISMLPGFSRPAYCSPMPVETGFRYMLDLGANVDADADSLLEFARLGTTLINVLEDEPAPRVALLSNGTEPGKGNLAIREAAKLMEDDPLINYCGYIEGNSLHRAGPELVVCDGMLGNVALKTAEGTAGLASRLINEGFRRHWWLRIVAVAAAPALRRLQETLSADLHGGAFLLGLRGVVVKSHGGSNPAGFGAAVHQAARCVENDMVGKLQRFLDSNTIGQTKNGETDCNDTG
jgi:glycerol-3-phosphate acyltransferase PlsX